MPLHNYGVLKGQVVALRPATRKDTYFHIHLVAGRTSFRISINVRSKTHPSELLFLFDDDFQHPVTEALLPLDDGFTRLAESPGGAALDYIRANLFDPGDMVALPFNRPGPDNDLNDKIERMNQCAIADPHARLYAFGQRWGPLMGKKDKRFAFKPSNGMHDVHMNQGNVERFQGDDGPWQDGGLIFHFPAENRWAAAFLAFQSQTFHTDDDTGRTLEQPEWEERLFARAIAPARLKRMAPIRIIAALVNPGGAEEDGASVTLINASPAAIDLAGWALVDQFKNKLPLTGTLIPGATHRVGLSGALALTGKGGIVSVVNGKGLKAHGIAYTEEQARRKGWTLVF